MSATVESTPVADEYRGVPYRVERRENPTPGYHYEFHLVVDGDDVTTASRLEANGWTAPWVPALERYAKAYIDGEKDQ